MSDKNSHDTLYSSHIFMFPFRFDWNEEGFEQEFEFYKSTAIYQRITLNTLNQNLIDNGWSYKPFEIKGTEQNLLYNEYAYFYDYARDTIYNDKSFNKDAISNYYDKDELNGEIFELNIKKRKEPYSLIIKGVSLRVFNTGVAILSIELENHEYKTFQDILNINDFGRRVYPQFIGKGADISATKDAFLADSIKIGDLEEKFEYRDFSDTQIGNHIMQLLGNTLFTQHKKERGKYYIQPSLDDRMFVVSWYGNDALSADLQVATEHYSQSDKWYKYLFVDNSFVTVQNDEMKRALLKNATYDRWSNFKTLFGITRYSFVVLTESEKSLQKNGAEFIINHSKTMYFQMITLLLATRTSILRFSDEIAALASTETLDTEKLTKLYQRYLIFYNRLYFKEVTHQDQGIELYDMARKQMKIDEHMEKLDGKFTKLFEFAELQERKRKKEFDEKKLELEKEAEEKRSKAMDNLTIMGAIFLPPSLMVALFSMGIFDYAKGWFSLSVGLTAIFASGYLGYKAIKGLLGKHNA